jgi:hypothetical protein
MFVCLRVIVSVRLNVRSYDAIEQNKYVYVTIIEIVFAKFLPSFILSEVGELHFTHAIVV